MSQAINRKQLVELMELPNLQLVEALPEAEFLEAHLPGAINISLKDLDGGSVSALNENAPTVVY